MEERLLKNQKNYATIAGGAQHRVRLHSEKNLVTLTWKNIDVYTSESKSFWSKFRKAKAKQDSSSRSHIVQNASGIARPGELLAIMGASGAGKTTLMNVLTYRNRGDLIRSGQVKINGQIIEDPTQLASLSAYVQQDDLFIGTLKVKEHLKFQAMLRLPETFTHAEKMERVEQCLNDLNLKKCEETLIGSPHLGVKGISGGERRRLAFASEIITNPSILFCDEPTSGLDSYMAMSIVESMKSLAKQGKTIICTIHQPSSEIFEMFDRLYLMAEGRLAYTGSLIDAFKFFADQGYLCPSNYNPADFYIKNLSIMPSNREECIQKVKKISDGYETSEIALSLHEEIKNASTQKDSNQNSLITAYLENPSTYKTNSFVQLRWLLWRNFLSTSRNPMETRISVIQTIFIAIVFGLIYLRQTVDQEGVQNINGMLFLLVTNNSFSNIFPVINSFPAEIPIFLREHHAGMYRVINYYFSKFMVELPRFLLIPFIFVTICYWMCGLNSDAIRYLICCGTIIFVANNAVSFASFISAVSPSVNVALAISAPLLVPLMIFSGFFLNNSWINYANNILVMNQWEGVTHIDCPSNSTRCYKNGDDVIKALNIDEDTYFMNFVYLAILYVGWRVLGFASLLFRAHRNK